MAKQTVNRREFLSTSGRAALAASVVPAFSINVLGANEKVVVGLMGAGGRGSSLVEWFAERPDVEVAYVADPDTSRYEACVGKLEKQTGKKPQGVQDFRKMLEDREVDAMINATPDHWHALGTVWACQAGKDVYVEKPTCHDIREGVKMVEAARKHGRIVQVGTQNRSAHYAYEALDYINSADFGAVHFIRVMNNKPRNTIGKLPDTDVPAGIDYNMWLGPAPMRPFNMNHFHYNWHWFWAYSGGDIINDGVHQIDMARWMSGRVRPKTVVSGGGIYFFNDDQETPDTHSVVWDFDGMSIVFEQTLWTPYFKKVPMPIRDGAEYPNWPFTGTRIEIYGEKQFMYLSRHGGGWQVFSPDETLVAQEHGAFTESNHDHIANFIECIRSRETPNADVEQVNLSTNLCHYGNIAYRVGRRLTIDQETGLFVNDDEANALVKRDYREPWVLQDEA